MKHISLAVKASALAAAASLLLCGCAGVTDSIFDNTDGNQSSKSGSYSSETTLQADITQAKDAEDDRVEISGDFTLKEKDSGTAITASNGVFSITSEGTYVLEGKLENGTVEVNAPEDAKVVLELNGCSLTSSSDSPLQIISCDKATVKAIEGTFNEITDSRSNRKTTFITTDDDSAKGAIYAKADLTLSGNGSLCVTGNYNNGVHTTKDLTVKNLTLSVTAYNHALKGNDSVTVKSGNLVLKTTGGHGIKSSETEASSSGNARGIVTIEDGSTSITSGKDGINASTNAVISGGSLIISAKDDGIHADSELLISGGSTAVTTSYEGLEGTVITISGGSTTVYATDDGMNASSNSGTPLITISGGTLDITTRSGDTDGIDSNGSLAVTGGFTIVKGGSSAGSVSGSIDVNGKITVTGGTVIALGGICELPSNSQICTVTMNGKSFAAGDYVIQEKSGSELITFSLSSSYSNAWICSDKLSTGTSYVMTKSGSSFTDWTQSSVTTQNGTTVSGGMGGGGQGGFGGGGFGGGGSRGGGTSGRRM